MRFRFSSLFSAALLWACSAENQSDLFDDVDDGAPGVTSNDATSGGSSDDGSTNDSNVDGSSSTTSGAGAASSSDASSSGGTSSGGATGDSGGTSSGGNSSSDSSSGGTSSDSGGSSSGGTSSDSGGSASGGTSSDSGGSSSGGTSGGSGGTSSGGTGGSEPATTGEAGNNGGPHTVEISLEAGDDCDVVRCPEEAPYPVACDIVFTEPGLDSSACVAVESQGQVFIRSGLTCSGTSVESGTITCSEERPEEPLGPDTCIIHNKDELSVVEGRCRCPGNVPGCDN